MARYKGGSRAREEDVFNPSKLREEWITPQLAKAKYPSDAVLRSEYSRLRSIAMKRLGRMEGKAEAAETLAQHAEGFPTLKEIGSDRADVVTALSDLSRFLSAKRSSISGIRESNKRITSALQAKGINVSQKDLKEYGKFMNRMKRAFGVSGGSYGSQRIADAWNELKSKGRVSKKDMQKALDQAKIDIEKENRRRIGKHRKSFNARKARSSSRRRK